MKKMGLVFILFLLFMSTVSASSLNGNYKGNPIVTVYSDSTEVKPDDVPAMIYDGRTLVPISLLKKIGLDVVWDASTYSVDVNLPLQPEAATEPAPDSEGSITSKIAKALGSKGLGLITTASYVSYGNDADIIQLEANFDLTKNDAGFNALLNIASVSEASIIEIRDSVGVQLFVNIQDVLDYQAGKLSAETFFSKVKIYNTSIPLFSSPSPQPTATPVPTPYKADNSAMCSQIISDYEVAKANAIVLENRRGGFYSGGLEAQLTSLKTGRDNQLKQLGCPIPKE